MRDDERLKVIYETATSIIIRTPEAWAEYLAFASRIYKYSFDNALLVYAQDPGASMLATKEIWKRVGRDPIDKAKHIAVCEYKNARNSLKYLFDVSQTNGHTLPKQWTADESRQPLLALRLSERYNLNNPYLSLIISQLVHEAMEQSFEQYMQDFELDIAGHFFAELPKDGLYAQIREIVEASAQIFVCSRCGIEAPKSCLSTLSTISHFDTVPLAARLGNIITEVSKHILLEIERTVKLLAKERSENHGEEIEPGIYRERWPALSEHQHRGRGGEQRPTPTQVRTGLDEPPAQEPSAAVHDPADDRRSGSDRPESGRGSSGTAGNNLSTAIDEKPASANRGHAGEGPSPKQPAPDSGGNRDDGNRPETEITTEQPSPEEEPQGSFLLPEIFYTPKKHLPYQVGDVILSLSAQARIVKITDANLFYALAGEDENTAPHAMKRERFETNLESGVYQTIRSDDAELYVGPAESTTETAVVEPVKQAGGNDGLVIGTDSQNNSPAEHQMTDEEYRQGYEHILTSTVMYPESMYTAIRSLFAAGLGISEKAQALAEIYQQYGNAELQEDILYRTALRKDDGLSFYIGADYTYMSWFEIAVLIDALIEDGDYPDPREQEINSLAKRIGDYNIPDEVEEMNGAGDTDEPETETQDSYEPTDEELYADVDGFLALTHNLYDGWQEEMAAEVAKVQADEYHMYALFRDIEEKPLSVGHSYVECFAFADHVTIRVNNLDLDFTYQEIAERIKTLIEIGNFPIPAVQPVRAMVVPKGGQPDFAKEVPPPSFADAQFIEISDIPRFEEIDTFVPVPKIVEFAQNAGQQISLFDLTPHDSDNDETPDASFVLDEETAGEDGAETHAAEPLTEPAAPEAPKNAPAPQRSKRLNYHYSADDNLYPPGAKTKFHNNMEAIRLLQRIESERRWATADEQKILARYVGWGGIAEAFNPKAESWDKEYRELKLALDEKDYAQARDSILTAYYTEPELVSCLYGALAQFGFTNGKNRRILDPAMGTGNFYAVLPEQLQNAKLTGVEIDSITGRLARQLYPTVDIQITGFETSKVENDTYDVAVGNVPFNEIQIYDRRYKDNYYIHDYFFIRALDALKPGGIAIFISSKGTLDKTDTSAREKIARRADLLGAIRLPDHTFKALAGTEVTTDILFLKKLEQQRNLPKRQLPAWVFTDNRPGDSMRLNQYYLDHPDMILGEMKYVSGRFGRTEACVAPEGQELYPLLRAAVGKLQGEFTAQPDEEFTEQEQKISTEGLLEAPEGMKTYTYQIQDGKIYYCSDGKLHPQDITGKKAERILGLCAIREALRQVIDIQSSDRPYDPSDLQAAQAELNRRYDAFVKKNGPINDKGNILAFSDDDTFPLLRSIEDYDKQSAAWNKSPVFTRATIRPNRLPDHAESALQALQISLNLKQKVDIPFMAKLYRKSPEEVIAELGGRIYLNPRKYSGNPFEGWELDEEYLSGYVKDKLAYAKLRAEDNPELFQRNVEALQAVQPKDLLPGDIEYSIGTPWIPIEYYTQFMYETFGTYERHKGTESYSLNVEYMEYSNQWFITGKQQERDSVKVNKVFGTSRKNAYEILEDTLNLQSVTVRDKVKYTDYDGKEKERYVVNAQETMIARGKQQQIKEAFRDWLFQDKVRSEVLLKIYNETFNNVVPRTYDGSHLVFSGMSDTEQLRPHQLNVAARIIYNGTALMAHEVGAGKTAAMVAAGMYMKRAGIVNKPLYVVPNHIIDQWANEFLRFFPSASLLVTNEKDFEKKNRRRFVSKIAMGEYDGIIISHSQFEKIAMSRERQEKMLTDEINHLSFIIDQIKAEKGENWSIKQMVIFQKNLTAKLDRLVNADTKDDLIDFEALGIDYLFVDEAHMYKNCFSYTKIRNVAGISTASSQRAADMKLKCHYLLEKYQGRGVTFATGTPISNSLAEFFIMQTYLQPQELKRRKIDFFDNWAATYAQTTTSLEIRPEGTGYRMRTRFARFQNLPELMNIFFLVADIQTEDMLGLPVPEIEGGKAQAVVTETTEFQKEVLATYIQRAEAIRKGEVEPYEDNMLKLTHEAKLLSIDPRLLYSDAPNDPDSKLNVAIRNVYDTWQDGKEKRLTQIVFCDSGTPKPGQFNVYDEMKSCLIKRGVPEQEIAFIHDAKTDAQREALFEKVRAGLVTILLGSTQKLGMGTNVQDRLYCINHLDCPWRPSDIQQRNGRGKRQGNLNPLIKIRQYVTRGTFDSYLWQIQEQKLRFITQVMTGKAITRTCEDIDETVLTAAEFKAIATNNPLLAEKMNVDNEVTRLSILQSSWQNERASLRQAIEKGYPGEIARITALINQATLDIQALEQTPSQDFSLEINGVRYSERAKAGEALEKYLALVWKEDETSTDVEIGLFRGLKIQAGREFFTKKLKLLNNGAYSLDMSDSGIGNITRMENLIEKLPDIRSDYEKKLADVQVQLAEATLAAAKPFQYAALLEDYSRRQGEINTQLEFQELSAQADMIFDENDSPTATVLTPAVKEQEYAL
ncbi:SNF2-related protein [Desulfosporosinus lacus]|uniref:Adenine-specific DNA methylase, N12 class n=1 Tax=Desulfosporosinus lacus DSM 15449 TaxID=1121420 RepID=A0A1M5UYR1_9FIRM|nr:SNF2-related protein [Desulfosporosinus lacus]SHH68060.1 Adenine-specific DNA methylase, N12 class [Desulfosporosinus lacus DSM 15449]